QTTHAPAFRIQYAAEIEAALAEIGPLLPATPISARSVALLWLSGDPVSEAWLQENAPALLPDLRQTRAELQRHFPEPLAAVIQRTRMSWVEGISRQAMIESGANWHGLSMRLGRLTTHPVWGLGILAVVLYALYWFVGIFGAGTL